MRTKIYFILSIIVLSCKPDPELIKYYKGTFPDNPVNMRDINSEYDDYNSDSPSIGETSPLCFSSNRNSKGQNFDIIYKLLNIGFNRVSGKLRIEENTSTNLDVYIQNENINNALLKINTQFDEYGPYLVFKYTNYSNSNNINKRYYRYILLYSNNERGNQDINFLHNMSTEEYTLPKPIKYLNSKFDDAYPSISKDSSKLYFCSNRFGNFDILYVQLTPSIGFLNNISDTSNKVVIKDTILSSQYDDKCPFIIRDYIVFSSNRNGGFGGYDLYYSYIKDGNWVSPINFGNKINTEYDEYRPMVKFMPGFTNDFMIFSSNRPGGKGGFDLYYTGIDKIENYN
jgi:hypothetical protein